ncbi:histidine kinase, partial [Paenibacillus riograndensis]
MYRTLEDQISIAFKTLIFLKQDETVKSVLTHPEQQSGLENKRRIENIFKNLNNSFFLYNPSVYFMILDLNESAYTSYPPRESLIYKDLRESPGFDRKLMNPSSYHWVPNDSNYVLRDVSTSAYLLSLYVYQENQYHKPNVMDRNSIVHCCWLQSSQQQCDLDQQCVSSSNHA